MADLDHLDAASGDLSFINRPFSPGDAYWKASFSVNSVYRLSGSSLVLIPTDWLVSAADVGQGKADSSIG